MNGSFQLKVLCSITNQQICYNYKKKMEFNINVTKDFLLNSAVYVPWYRRWHFFCHGEYATGPINWRIIINKCPPGIVFIFTIMLTEYIVTIHFFFIIVLKIIHYCITILKTIYYFILL